LGSQPSKKSVRRLVTRISTETARWRTDREVGELVEQVNVVLRGWAGYFRLGSVSKAYRILDSHTKNRLRRWLCEKHKIQGPLRSHYPDRYMYERLGLDSTVRRNESSHDMIPIEPDQPVCARYGLGMWYATA
jgi:RNA-directed DNA polymerase